MNKLKLLILAIMIMFIVNVSVFCILIYGIKNMDTIPLNLSNAPTDTNNKTINIQNGEILIVDKCNKD